MGGEGISFKPVAGKAKGKLSSFRQVLRGRDSEPELLTLHLGLAETPAVGGGGLSGGKPSYLIPSSCSMPQMGASSFALSHGAPKCKSSSE